MAYLTPLSTTVFHCMLLKHAYLDVALKYGQQVMCKKHFNLVFCCFWSLTAPVPHLVNIRKIIKNENMALFYFKILCSKDLK